jgi:hypothetical protein
VPLLTEYGVLQQPILLVLLPRLPASIPSEPSPIWLFGPCAIFRREAAEITRTGWFVFWDDPEPFNESMTEIACSNFSTCDCAY